MQWLGESLARMHPFDMEPNDRSFIKSVLLVYAVCLWGHVGFIACCDRYSWFREFKIQGDAKSDNPSRQEGRDRLVITAFFHVIPSHIISVFAFVSYFRPSSFGMKVTYSTMPDWHVAAGILIWWHVLFDTWFYWTHRALHHRYIYRFIHKQHHQFREPTGVAAFYAHPLEDLFVNVASTFIGPMLFPSKPHEVTQCTTRTHRVFVCSIPWSADLPFDLLSVWRLARHRRRSWVRLSGVYRASVP